MQLSPWQASLFSLGCSFHPHLWRMMCKALTHCREGCEVHVRGLQGRVLAPLLEVAEVLGPNHWPRVPDLPIQIRAGAQ